MLEDTIKEARRLWEELGDIPIDNDDNIDCKFLHFEKGTNKFDIWHWFERRFDLSVAEDLMYN